MPRDLLIDYVTREESIKGIYYIGLLQQLKETTQETKWPSETKIFTL